MAVEIRDVIFRTRRRVVLLVLVAVLSATIAGGLSFTQDREYRSRASFVAPSQNRESPTAVEQSIANLRANITSEPVVSAAAEAGGIAAKEVRSGVEVARRGSSDTVEVVFTTTRRDVAQEVTRAAAQAVVREVTAPDVERAHDQLLTAEDELTIAQDDLDTFLDENGLSLPDDQYRAVASELTSLRVALATARVDGSSRVAGLEQAVAEAEGRLAELAELVREFHILDDAASRAERRVEAANEEVDRMNAFLAIVNDDNLQVSEARAVPRLDGALRTGVSAAAITVIACVVLLVLLEFRAGAGSRTTPAHAAPEPLTNADLGIDGERARDPLPARDGNEIARGAGPAATFR